MNEAITLRINGAPHELGELDPATPLLWVLRDTLGLTGTKFGCGMAQCGACTVHVDGRATRSCVLPVGSLAGRAITTIEGVQEGSDLHPLQQAFLDYGAVQCGFCTPGLIMTAKALLDVNTSPTEDEISEALAGAICRCTGHIKVKTAVRRAAEMIREREAAAG